MPVTTLEGTVKGLPHRWGVRAFRELCDTVAKHGRESEQYQRLCDLLDEVVDAPLAIDSTDAQLCLLAERMANECTNAALDIHEMRQARAIMETIVRNGGVEPPTVKDDIQAVMRCMDAMWWRRSLRKTVGRAREHAAIRLGFVSSRAGKYCSDEAATARVAQNRRNAASLKSTKMLNVETGQQFSLDELAAKGTGNNKIRRGELMLRMDGCDEVAQELGHKGLFVTLTAPSAYHAVLEKTGARNPKYNGANPRDTQDYMNGVWVLTRAQNDRDGIAPYGFRVAEPHHDGCTHWHMVVFMPAEHIPVFVRNLSGYALAEDGDEPGAQERRVTFKEIDPAQGTAAAYMAKYVAKNIGDGKLEEDKNGKTIITKEMRVDAWAGLWGIRQFQPLGLPPVTGYREMRRVPESAIEGAPEHVRMAWRAGNRIPLIDEETGEVAGMLRCDFAAYIRAQGGVNRGRDYRIAIATETRLVAGRYGLQKRDCPTGLYCKLAPEFTYQSVRYTWKRIGAEPFRPSRSPVNNCTEAKPWPKRPTGADVWFNDAPLPEPVAEFDTAWFDTDEYRAFLQSPIDVANEMLTAEYAAAETYAATIWTLPSYLHGPQQQRNK